MAVLHKLRMQLSKRLWTLLSALRCLINWEIWYTTYLSWLMQKWREGAQAVADSQPNQSTSSLTRPWFSPQIVNSLQMEEYAAKTQHSPTSLSVWPLIKWMCSILTVYNHSVSHSKKLLTTVRHVLIRMSYASRRVYTCSWLTQTSFTIGSTSMMMLKPFSTTSAHNCKDSVWMRHYSIKHLI